MKRTKQHTITLFHCINALSEKTSIPLVKRGDVDLKIVKMPCSNMVKDVFLLRAFEAGSDAVVVIACAEEQCRFVEGSIRAKKRVERVKNILDEIGLDGERLSLHNIPSGDELKVNKILQKTIEELSNAGPIRVAA